MNSRGRKLVNIALLEYNSQDEINGPVPGFSNEDKCKSQSTQLEHRNDYVGDESPVRLDFGDPFDPSSDAYQPPDEDDCSSSEDETLVKRRKRHKKSSVVVIQPPVSMISSDNTPGQNNDCLNVINEAIDVSSTSGHKSRGRKKVEGCGTRKRIRNPSSWIRNVKKKMKNEGL
ncbi:hypothetical protein J6590_083960 [Homalodisca vitripennis]|nr:hypothetical protein J6590_083960 [Homalodisca vitripennis]